MFKKFIKTVNIFILASVLVHLLIYGGLVVSKMAPPAKKSNVVEFILMNSPDLKKSEKQIVEQSKKRLNDETPNNSRFLSQFNQNVTEQTRAKDVGQFNNQVQIGGKQIGSAKKKAKKKIAAGNLPSLKKLKPTFDLSPNKDRMGAKKIAKNSRTPDHIKDVKTGIQTLLSTREFVYYAYYQRIRSKIRQQWEPIIRAKVQKVYSSGRSIASSRDRITQVVIILNKTGNLINVQVIGESGIRDLDDAAIDAFRAAEPFPNPPKGIVEADGKIRIRWDFVLEAKSQPEEKRDKHARAVDRP